MRAQFHSSWFNVVKDSLPIPFLAGQTVVDARLVCKKKKMSDKPKLFSEFACLYPDHPDRRVLHVFGHPTHRKI